MKTEGIGLLKTKTQSRRAAGNGVRAPSARRIARPGRRRWARSRVLCGASFVIVLSLAACTHPEREKHAPEDSFKLLSNQDGTLGWAGFALGMTRTEAERRLGTPLSTQTMDSPACGAQITQTAVAERAVVIQWSDAGADAALQSIAVTLAPAESRLGADKLAARARRAVPALKPVGEAQDAQAPTRLLGLENHSDQILLLKSDASEHVFYLTQSSCLD